MTQFQPLADRLWSKIDRKGPDDCWPWTGARAEAGYGQIKKPGGHGAHRAVYEIVHGVVLTPDIKIRHSCDNPPCCNPRHLLAGTDQDNMDDKMNRGRHRSPGAIVQARGRSHGMAKLTESQVLEIRKDPRTQTEIAASYGVNQQQISAIKSGKKWRHI